MPRGKNLSGVVDGWPHIHRAGHPRQTKECPTDDPVGLSDPSQTSGNRASMKSSNVAYNYSCIRAPGDDPVSASSVCWARFAVDRVTSD